MTAGFPFLLGCLMAAGVVLAAVETLPGLALVVIGAAGAIAHAHRA